MIVHPVCPRQVGRLSALCVLLAAPATAAASSFTCNVDSCTGTVVGSAITGTCDISFTSPWAAPDVTVPATGGATWSTGENDACDDIWDWLADNVSNCDYNTTSLDSFDPGTWNSSPGYGDVCLNYEAALTFDYGDVNINPGREDCYQATWDFFTDFADWSGWGFSYNFELADVTSWRSGGLDGSVDITATAPSGWTGDYTRDTDGTWDFDESTCSADALFDSRADVYPGASEVRDGVDQDCDGLWDEGTVSAGELIVTEFMPNPYGTDADKEYIEVTNTTATDLNLSGWTLTNASGSYNVTLPYGDDTLVVPAWDSALLAASDDPTVNCGLDVLYAFGRRFVLTNSSQQIIVEFAGALIRARMRPNRSRSATTAYSAAAASNSWYSRISSSA